MKHEKWAAAWTAVLLATLTAWGTVGALVTAFDLSDSLFLLLAVCAGTAILAALLFSLRHGGIAVLCLLALTSGYLYHDGRMVRQLWQLIHHLSTIYHRAYGCGTLILPEGLEPGTGFLWPLGLMGSLIAIAACRCVCCGTTVWLPVLCSLLPLCSCIVVTDTVPGELWLFMVMAGLLLLLLPAAVRRENPTQGLRLTAAATFPVLLGLTSLFLLIPQEDYVNHSELFRENIITAAKNIPQLMESGISQTAARLRGQPQSQVDLAALGARIPFTYPVMEVTSEAGGTIYLRQQDYRQYTGLGWGTDPDSTEIFSWPSGTSQAITIHPNSRQDYLYLPYYPLEELHLEGGLAKNTGRQDFYTIQQTSLPDNWRQIACQSKPSSPQEWADDLALPEMTRQGAASCLTGLYPETASNTEKADLIAALVTSRARYDLNAERMPAGEPDFALWFLREAECGYCVHYATAATVLLRAAGVPARYVTGYLLEAEAGQAVTVTEENAHAWAEYYEPGLNVWIPLEATPAGEEAVPVPSLSAPIPAETQPATVPETIPPATQAPEPEISPTQSAPLQIPEPSQNPEQTDSQASLSLWFLCIPLLLLLPTQRSLRLSLRWRQQRQGGTNRQALARWQEAVRLSRLLKDSPTEELIVLAQKAKFSQYTLTQEELMQFDSFNRSCLRRLKEKPWYLRLIDQYVYAAY